MKTKYLHTMVRVKDLDASMRFYGLLGLKETRRIENDKGRFTLVFMAPEGQPEAPVELTHNWDGDEGLPSDSRHFGHLAYEVEDIYAMCEQAAGGGGDDQPAAAGRAHGVRALARQRVGRAAADGRAAGAGGAVEEHGKHGAPGERPRRCPGAGALAAAPAARRRAGWRCRWRSTCRARWTRASTGCRRRGWRRRWWRRRWRRRSWRSRGSW